MFAASSAEGFDPPFLYVRDETEGTVGETKKLSGPMLILIDFPIISPVLLKGISKEQFAAFMFGSEMPDPVK